MDECELFSTEKRTKAHQKNRINYKKSMLTRLSKTGYNILAHAMLLVNSVKIALITMTTNIINVGEARVVN